MQSFLPLKKYVSQEIFVCWLSWPHRTNCQFPVLFQALSSRARKARAARKPQMSELKSGTVIENLAQTRRLAETALGAASSVAPATSSGLEEERPTNTGSGSQVRQLTALLRTSN